jgi:TonB family protein
MSSQPPRQQPPSVRERAQNFLLYGFLLSVALHVIIGPFIRFERTPDAPEKVETVKVEKMPTPPPTPKPTPTPQPTPPPTPPPKQTPPPEQPRQIKINTLKQTSQSNNESSEAANTHTAGSTTGVPVGTPTGAAATEPPAPPPTAPPATPVPTPPPACKNPNVPPHVVAAAQPDTPPIAQQQGITGDVEVVVTLDANSRQSQPPTVRKSPSRILNAAAIDAARQSRFQTEIRNCTPIAAQYLFIVEFTSQ